MDKKAVNLGLKEVRAEIIYHKYKKFDIKTLLISFEGEKRRVLSTWDGYRKVKFVANVSIPWTLAGYTMKNYEKFEREFPRYLGISLGEISFLTTGADMDNLAVCKKSYQEFNVCCVTTGGTGNALRSGVDKGNYVERNGKFHYAPGTINIIILFNVALTTGAMARAIITATEAKTAALQDLDVRSAFSPEHKATGTGTDNIIIVSGKEYGMPLRWTGGHTRIGELIATSTRFAVIEALEKQEGQSRIMQNSNT
ncbi:MAG: adenosylcobinamide amidohydrolase [Candidatus Bathyarchaeia archaeon]